MASQSDDIKTFSQLLIINVGGKKYTISTRSLQEYKESELYKLCIDEAHQHERDHEGNVFINRDGDLFKYVLRYMQQGQLVLPKGYTDTDALAVEASYYGVKKLAEELEKHKKKQMAIIWVKLLEQTKKSYLDVIKGHYGPTSVSLPGLIQYCCSVETYQNLEFLKDFCDLDENGGNMFIDGRQTTFEMLQTEEGGGKRVDIFHYLEDFKFFETLAKEGFEQKEKWSNFVMYSVHKLTLQYDKNICLDQYCNR